MKPLLRDPSFVGALVCFHRVALHLSFSKAAEDLGVTTSAVSHRIKRLETALGQRLFDRAGPGITLTAAGRRLQAAVDTAFRDLEQETAAIAAAPTLRLSVGPYLSVSWLMPLLTEYEQEEGGAPVELVHRIGNAPRDDVDIAIVWAEDSQAPEAAIRLFSPRMVPVGSSNGPTRGEVWARGLAPLHYRSRVPWQVWLDHVGGPASFASQGEIFDDPNIVLEAAAHQRGIALGFAPFFAEPVRSGRLARLSETSAPSPESYWLSTIRSPAPAVERLARWIVGKARMADPDGTTGGRDYEDWRSS